MTNRALLRAGRARLILSTVACAAAAVAALAAPTGAATSAPAAAAPVDARPNIVFITTDDMRERDLRAMPNVRGLLKAQGTTFTHSYAPFPLCCPARAAWVTGQYNHNNGVMGNSTEEFPEGGYAALENSSTVATWLRDAGYQTAFVGKFLNHYGEVRPFAVPPGWIEWHAAVGINSYYSTGLRENHTGSLVSTRYEGVYQVDLYDSIARRVLTRRLPSAAPLFLWVSQFAPHSGGPAEPDDPVVSTPAVPSRYRDFFAGTPLPNSESYSEADVADKPTYIRSRRPISAAMEAQLTESNQQRWESLKAVDESVGRIVSTLRTSGELENTVIAFGSDNGYMMGEHRLHAGKTVPYEESSRVPLIIRGPGFDAGATRTAWVANIDVAPTFADLADATPTLTVDGRSLLPLVQDPASWPDRTLVLEAGPRTVGGVDLYHGVRTNRYKYVEYSTGEVEFYDLLADPDELLSLTANPAYDGIQSSLAAELKQMQACAGAGCR